MEYDDCIATTTTAKKTNRQHLKLDANRELCAPISVWKQRPTRLQCKQCTMIIKTEIHTAKQESDVWENNSAKHRKKGHNGPMIRWRVENNFNSMFETECFHLCCTLTYLLYRIASGLGSSSPSHWSILPYSWQNINNTTTSMHDIWYRYFIWIGSKHRRNCYNASTTFGRNFDMVSFLVAFRFGRFRFFSLFFSFFTMFTVCYYLVHCPLTSLFKPHTHGFYHIICISHMK